MRTLLSKVKVTDLITEPFPHIVIKDALDKDTYLQLASEWPSIDTLSKGVENQGRDLFNNKRIHYLASESLIDSNITTSWKNFITLHTSSIFLSELTHLFKEPILKMYPQFGKLHDHLKSGIRNIDTFETADVLLDTLICINTPVVSNPTSVRRAHVDLPNKLFAGLFYMRHPQDTSTGGDLEIYKFKNGRPDGFRNCQVSEKNVELVKVVEYDQNVLILFLNSIYSLHGVNVRSLTNYPRYFINLVGEVEKPLFEPWNYQEKSQKMHFREIKSIVKKIWRC